VTSGWEPGAWLDTLTDGSRLRPPDRTETGGEWDGVRQLGTRTRRRLAGGRYVRSTGYAPDVLAHTAAHILGKELEADEFVDMYVRLAEGQMDENQSRESQLFMEQRRRDRLATKHGCKSFANYRDQQARALGFSSLYDMRKHRWPDSIRKPDAAAAEAIDGVLR
jgi:hypothetical protein